MPSPPFKIRQSESAFWIEDINGVRFAYFYHDDRQIVGTGQEKLTKAEALELVKRVARFLTDSMASRNG